MPSVLRPQSIALVVEFVAALPQLGNEYRFRKLTQLGELLEACIQIIVELRDPVDGSHIENVQRTGLEGVAPASAPVAEIGR